MDLTKKRGPSADEGGGKQRKHQRLAGKNVTEERIDAVHTAWQQMGAGFKFSGYVKVHFNIPYIRVNLAGIIFGICLQKSIWRTLDLCTIVAHMRVLSLRTGKTTSLALRPVLARACASSEY